MDEVFESQFRAMQVAFARDGIGIDIAYTPAGQLDYLYVTGRLLAINDPELLRRIEEILPGTRPAGKAEYHPHDRIGKDEYDRDDRLAVLSIEHLERGYLTVPEAMRVLDAELGDGKPALRDGQPVLTPLHVFYVTGNGGSPAVASGRLCPAGEPDFPSGSAPNGDCPPFPAQAPRGTGAGSRIAVCDTGLLANREHAPWLAGAAGETDPLGPPSGTHPGLDVIPHYTGHGTFGAGVARCQAPGADIYVANAIPGATGAVIETSIAASLTALMARRPAPQVINLSAGGYTRCDWAPLAFRQFTLGDITLTAAAGNDASSREFWPAAFGWAIGVGALASDQQSAAWFTNYGDWVQVYTLGENLVNAYATGVYTYRDKPKPGTTQPFKGMALWSGTSFAAPLVAGLIAAELAGSPGTSVAHATANVLATADAQRIHDPRLNLMLPRLYPGHP